MNNQKHNWIENIFEKRVDNFPKIWDRRGILVFEANLFYETKTFPKNDPRPAY